MSDSKYLNGVFMEEKEGQYGPYISISISAEGLKALNNLPKSDKGYVNLTAGRQQKDANKFSVKPYQPKAKAGNGGSDSLPF